MRVLKAGLAAAAAFIAFPANAAIVDITSFTYAKGGLFGGIDIGTPAFRDGGTAGQFLASGSVLGSGAPFSALTFCTDVFTPAFSYVFYETLPLSTLLSDATKQTQLAGLLSKSNALIAAASSASEADEIATAIGLATWELIYEAGNTGYSVSAGNFSVYGDFAPLAGLANGYLANVESGLWSASASRVVYLRPTDVMSQGQVYFSPGVPEPASWAMIIAGFGLAGAALRRKGLVAGAQAFQRA